MALKVRLESSAESPQTRIFFDGTLDDLADFGPLLRELKQKSPEAIRVLGLELDGVKRTNSVGIRQWLIFLEQLPMETTLIFLSLSAAFVEQGNMIPNLFGRLPVRIASFQVPYSCSSCENLDSRRTVLSEVTQSKPGVWSYPRLSCGKCQSAMELDGLEDEYFRFIHRGVMSF